jgi:RNA polymerase sigma factor (sigma-70 family)
MRTADDKRDDGTLVQRARGGDRDAFTALVSRYRGMVYAAAFCFLGNAEDAQDAAQEAFVAAYGRLGQLREPDKFAPWLRRLASNGCTDSLRRRGARGLSLDGDAACRVLATPDGAEGVLTRLAVQAALGCLTEQMRLTVTLCYLGGYTHAEVARFLEVPVNTVRSRLQHAKRKLREEMRDMVHEGLNEGRPDAVWTRRVVDEAMRRGAEAADTYEKGAAVQHYDEALAAIETLPPGAERTRLTMEALRRKESMIRHSGHRGEAASLLERALTTSQELGDRKAQAEILGSLGNVSANREPQEAVQHYQQALEIYREIGDAFGQAESLLTLALHSLHAGDTAVGRSYLERARPLFEEVNSLDWLAVCRAMLNLLTELGAVDLSRLLFWHAVCDTWEKAGGRMSFQSQPGFMVTRQDGAAPRPLSISSIFWQVSRLHTFLDGDVPVGGRWVGNALSFSDQPLKATVAVLSDAEAVTVPAGTFAGCLLTEQVTTEGGPANEMNKELCGTVRAWYARGVGLVQLHVRHTDGLEATLQLGAYEVGKKSRDFLPLAVGNRWEYGWANVLADYAAKEVYQVAARRESLWYVEHYAYAYRRREDTSD